MFSERERLIFHRNFIGQSFTLRLSYPYVSNAFPVLLRLLMSIPHLVLNRLKESVFRITVFNVIRLLSSSPYLKGLNSKSPVATDFLLICSEVRRLNSDIIFLNPFRSGEFNTALGLRLRL